MILPALVALPAALGPLLRGSWDVWAQSFIHFATVAGTVLWLSSRVIVGYIPLPSRRNLGWVLVLIVLGLISLWCSSSYDRSLPQWHNFLNALWLFPILAVVSKDERVRADTLLQASAWILMVLAFYQRLRLGDVRPESALVNENVYAGTILLFLPLAIEKNDWLLALGLLINLFWIESVGAWLGLSAALIVTYRSRGGVRPWIGGLGVLICAIVVYNKFQSPEVLDRVRWWKAACSMLYERPMVGFGPGSFEWVAPAFQSHGSYSMHAHQYFLQTAAEYGILFAIVWFSGLWSCVMRGNSYKRFGAMAVLFHSFWDWPMSMPANLWILSYFAASSLSEEPRGINVSARWKLPACAVVMLVGFLFCSSIWGVWAADRALKQGRIEASLYRNG